jgi:thiamine-monophosphate kinase
MHSPRLADLGELEVLRRLQPFCAKGVGDDALLLSLPPEMDVVVTTDILVEDVHFSEQTMPPRAVGWRAAAVNLSDLAAMGAQPLGLTVGAALPAETPWHWLEEVYQGLQACLNTYGGRILGGDLTRSAVKTLGITALGAGRPSQTLYRYQAQPQQAIIATGLHGASRAGLALLTGELAPKNIATPTQRQWIAAHQYPTPRFDAISILQALARDHNIALAHEIACMDSSDGLANAVIQLCQQSGVGAQIVRSQLPIPPGLVTAVGRDQAETWTLYGGEDFELVICVTRTMASALVTQMGGHCAIIGQTTNHQEIELVENLDDTGGLPLTLAQSYQHFS